MNHNLSSEKITYALYWKLMLPKVLDNKPELYKNDKPIAIGDDKCCCYETVV